MKKKLLLYFAVFVLAHTQAQAYNLTDWMSHLDGNIKLGQIGIPGTHDSGTFYGGTNLIKEVAQTQNWNIMEQLQNGIRFLDIRLSDDGNPRPVCYFQVRHGPATFGCFKDRVMYDINNFLTSYPNETIFMSIKHEQHPILKNTTFNSGRFEKEYVYSSDSKFHQKPIDASTQLKDVRGKIVLFNRDENRTIGINWNEKMAIQDDYKLSYECTEIPLGPFGSQRTCGPHVGYDYPKKYRAVKGLLVSAVDKNKSPPRQLWVNFTSAVGTEADPFSIKGNADWVNREVKTFIGQANQSVRSIIIMDYPDRTPGLIKSIVEHNKYVKPDRTSSPIPPPTTSNARWVSASNGNVPSGSLVSGHEANGEKLYVCRANYNGGLHPGKVRSAFRACNIGWGGREIPVNQYETYIDTSITWQAASSGQVPSSAVVAGHESNGNQLYICRGSYQSGVHSGKVRSAFGACNISWGGIEIKINPYEVLVR